MLTARVVKPLVLLNFPLKKQNPEKTESSLSLLFAFSNFILTEDALNTT